MQIDLDSLEGKEGRLAHAYAPEELAFADDRVRLIEPPEVSGRLIRDGGQIILKGSLRAGLQVDCDRCLKPLRIPVAIEFSLQYVSYEDYEAAHAAELEDADLGVSVFDGETIDLDELVNEQILLAVPQRMLCREDCKGLCPACGGDRNSNDCECLAEEADPRWAALKDLRF